MFKSFLILLLLVFLLFSCSKKTTEEIIHQPTEEEVVVEIYAEAVTALKKGDAYYAGKKFKEVESLMPQSEWAAKASLMAGYSDYSRNAYSDSVFGLERHISNYPADKNIPYAHYLIAMCYYEQILDEKKDLAPLLRAKKKFEFIILNYPDTDYANSWAAENTTSVASFSEVSYQLMKGIHLTTRYELFDEDIDIKENALSRLTLGADIFPFSFFEIKLQGRFTSISGNDNNSNPEYILQFHTWF